MKISHAVPFVLVALAVSTSSMAADGAGGELLHPPVAARGAASRPAAHELSYKLTNGSDKWDPAIRERIVKSMDEAIAIYNANGDFDRVLTVTYSAGTPTADSNITGYIRFGGQRNTRTALHEIGHTMGVGQAANWMKLAGTRTWTGEYALAQLREFDGPGAVLHCDKLHFWPYGLNQDDEGNPENFMRHVKMVVAIRADLGLGPPPTVNALEKARGRVVVARAALSKAQEDFSTATRTLKAAVESRTAVVAAANTEKNAAAAHNAAIARALDQVRGQADYQTAKAAVATAMERQEALKAITTSSSDALLAAAQATLTAKAALAKLENRATTSDARVAATKKSLTDATEMLSLARDAALKQDPQWLAAKEAVESALANAAATEKVVAEIEKQSVKKSGSSVPN
jgi:hypothetical protein